MDPRHHSNLRSVLKEFKSLTGFDHINCIKFIQSQRSRQDSMSRGFSHAKRTCDI